MSDLIRLRALSQAARDVLGGDEGELPANHPLAQRLLEREQAEIVEDVEPDEDEE